MALSSQDGRLAAKLETCGDADDVFVDAKRRRVYVSCGEGVVDVFEQREAGYGRLAEVPTVSGARTSLFVPELDRLHVAVRARSNEIGTGPFKFVEFKPNEHIKVTRNPDYLSELLPPLGHTAAEHRPACACMRCIRSFA
jgi:hypothetical protein